MEFDAQTREDIAQYQAIQQQLQMILLQKQQMQLQLSESKKAQEELTNYTGTAYRFAGGVLIEKKLDKLTEELKGERETLELRASVFEKQEGKLVERLRAIEGRLSKLQTGAVEGASVSAPTPGPSITKKGKGAA